MNRHWNEWEAQATRSTWLQSRRKKDAECGEMWKKCMQRKRNSVNIRLVVVLNNWYKWPKAESKVNENKSHDRFRYESWIRIRFALWFRLATTLGPTTFTRSHAHRHVRPRLPRNGRETAVNMCKRMSNETNSKQMERKKRKTFETDNFENMYEVGRRREESWVQHHEKVTDLLVYRIQSSKCGQSTRIAELFFFSFGWLLFIFLFVYAVELEGTSGPEFAWHSNFTFIPLFVAMLRSFSFFFSSKIWFVQSFSFIRPSKHSSFDCHFFIRFFSNQFRVYQDLCSIITLHTQFICSAVDRFCSVCYSQKLACVRA